MITAQTKLEAGLRERGPLCVGLDPDPARLPPSVHGDVAAFLTAIVEATAPFACAYKLNAAFFEALGASGFSALERVRAAIPPQALLIWDGKRGDIANTNRLYARAAFSTFGADAVTVHPYFGLEPLEPFFAYEDRLTFVLCATSEGHRLQTLAVDLAIGGRPVELWQWVATEAAALSRGKAAGRLGLVVGATVPERLLAVRSLAPGLPLLVPGVGAQGGTWPPPPALVNVSRSLLYSSRGADFAEAAAAAAKEFVHAAHRKEPSRPEGREPAPAPRAG